MALTFPRAMPTLGAASQSFEPLRNDFLSPENGGRLGALTAGFPLWRGEWVLGKGINEAKADVWLAWLRAQRGPMNLFFGQDYRRPFPMAYPKGFAGLVRAVGGAAFDGSATSWSINGTGDVLTLNGLPAGLAFSVCDYVDFRWTTGGVARRSLVSCVEPVTASGGGVATFAVEPPVPTITPGGAVAHLDNPSCLMRLTTDTQVDLMDRRKVPGLRVVALQDLLA